MTFLISGQRVWIFIHLIQLKRIPFKAIVLLFAVIILKKHILAHDNLKFSLALVILICIFTFSQALSSNLHIKHYALLLFYLLFTYVFTVTASLISRKSFRSVLIYVFCISNAIVIGLTPLSLVEGINLRLSSIFGTNSSAAFIAITLPFFFIHFKDLQNKTEKAKWFFPHNALFLTFIIFVLFTLLLFGSRSALLLLGLGLILSTILIYMPRYAYLTVFALLILSPFFSVFSKIQNKLSILLNKYYISIVHLLNLKAIDDPSGLGRLSVFSNIWDHGMTLWGYSLFTFREKFHALLAYENLYIEILFSFGIVGLSLMVFILMAIFYKLIAAHRNEKEGSQKAFLVGINISFFLTVIYGFFNDLLFSSIFWVIFAAGFALAHQYTSKYLEDPRKS